MQSIHALLATGAPLLGPGVWDALSATLAERAGFQTVFVSGYCLAASHLAAPDIGLLSGTEVLDAARAIVRAVGIPVVVDIDTGYGNERNVTRTVEDLVAMGAAGCFLEDQVWPKRCGHMEGKAVVPLDEYLPKLRAAVAARGTAAFHVTARTDARAPLGLDEAIRRALACVEAGADAVFVEAPQSVDEMARIRAAVPSHVPLVANMVEGGKTPLRTAAELADAGFQIVVLPVAGLLAATHAIEATWGAIVRDGTSTAMGGRMRTFAEMNALLGLER